MNLNEHIHIERDETGDYLISWTESFSKSPVDVYASTSADSANLGDLVHSGGENPVRVGLLREPHRHYFHLRPQDKDGVTVAERALALQGGTNFRDFGGYHTTDGRQVKWGKLYRSGHMSRLSDEDVEYLAKLAIRCCCDFRRSEEQHNEPTRLPDHTTIVNLTVDPGSVGEFFARVRDRAAEESHMADAMVAINREMVLDHQACYRQMFEELLALEEGALLINCSAGKDRTGYGAALILSALGVSRDIILHDYMLSSRYYQIEREIDRVINKYGAQVDGQLTAELVRPMMEAREEYLSAAFTAIDKHYATTENYLEQALGIGPQERELLRERLTA